jgi:aminoglycoside phosphotransferase (APT) family kinase protein
MPVSAVLDGNGGSLRMSFMEGIHGQELISAGQADRVLRACGHMLRRIHTIDPAIAHVEDQTCPPAVLVHGDYGPNNVLLDPEAEEVVTRVALGELMTTMSDIQRVLDDDRSDPADKPWPISTNGSNSPWTKFEDAARQELEVRWTP